MPLYVHCSVHSCLLVLFNIGQASHKLNASLRSGREYMYMSGFKNHTKWLNIQKEMYDEAH